MIIKLIAVALAAALMYTLMSALMYTLMCRMGRGARNHEGAPISPPNSKPVPDTPVRKGGKNPPAATYRPPPPPLEAGSVSGEDPPAAE